MANSVSLGALPVAAIVCDSAGVVQAANARAQVLFRRELAGAPVQELFPEEAGLDKRLRDAPVRLHASRADGVPFAADVETGPTEGGLVLLVTEVGGRRLRDESLRLNDVSFQQMPIGMAVFNTNGEYVRVNAALCRLLAREPDALLGRRDQQMTHPDDREADLVAARRILAGEADIHQCEKRFLRPDGSIVWALASFYFLRDEAGHPLCWVAHFQDVTDRKRSEQRLRRLADHDELTGIPNRRRLLADLELHLEHAGRGTEQGAVLVLDLEGCKAVHDAQGRDAGDAALITVAVALRRRLRVTDTLGRLGGDEFAAVVPHVDAVAAQVVADQLVEAVRDAAPAGVTASCGVAVYGPDRPGTAEALLAAADRAMCAARQAGRDAALAAG